MNFLRSAKNGGEGYLSVQFLRVMTVVLLGYQ